jgi:protein TonB
MNNPLKALSTEAGLAAEESGHIIPLKFVIYKTGNSAGESPRFGLADFKADLEAGEKGLSEYLLVGILAILAHVYLVQNFQDSASHEEVLTPVKTPPMVQITLVPPEPPKPIVQPPPPPPPPPPKKVEPIKKAEPPPPKKDVVALKPKPPKPRPAPKPVERVVEREEPTPEPSRVVDDAPPVKAAPPAPPAPPVEKVTPPSASAGYLHNPAPEYPAIAEEEGWSGRVVLKVHVMANGRPDNVTVAKSSGHEVLDQAAVHTVLRSWHFAPAKRGETPIDGWVSVPIVFNHPG